MYCVYSCRLHDHNTMDNTTLAIVGALVIGLIGAAAFLLSQPAEVKTRSAKGGLKPRGVR